MIEPINETTFRFKMAEDEVEVGDINAIEFNPHIKLKRWGEECFLCVKPAGDITEAEFEVEGDKIKSKYKVKQNGFELELESEFYALEPSAQNELGAFELNIILAKKPPTNKLVFDIETEGLKFYYQPELTPEEIAEGAIRLDNVIGSYAVYHATKRDHIVGQTNYRTGKAFHIYRPRIEDADGKWVWGELLIASGTLTVTIPQDFLDTAKYPICHATGATFGYTSEGGTIYTTTTVISVYIMGNYYYQAGSLSTLSESGTGTKISAYIYNDYTGGTPEVKFALFKDSDKSLVAVTAAVNLTIDTPSEFIEIDFTIPPSLTAQDYHIVALGNPGSGDRRSGIRYDSGGTTNQSSRDAVPSFDFVDPFVPGLLSDNKPSIYCTYTPGVEPQNYDRSAIVLVGSLTSASRVLAIDRDSSTLVGNLVSASRIRGAVRTSSVLIGNLVSAIKTWNPLNIGALAIDRASSTAGGSTLIAKENPANLTGTLTQVEIFPDGDMTVVKAGTFYGTPPNLTCRDYAVIGSVSAGKQIIKDLDIDAQTGDYIGIYFE